MEFERHVTFYGKIITDPRRLKRIMDRHDPSIYPGQYVTCVYNPDRAPYPDSLTLATMRLAVPRAGAAMSQQDHRDGAGQSGSRIGRMAVVPPDCGL
jgi:hypothetical protein